MPIKREVKYRARPLGRALQIGPSGRQSSERPAVLRCPLRAHVGEPGVLLLDPTRRRGARAIRVPGLPLLLSRSSRGGKAFPLRLRVRPPARRAHGWGGEGNSLASGRRARGSGSPGACGTPRPLGGGGEGEAGAGRGRLRVRAALAVFNLVRRARISGAQRLPMTPSAFVV